MPRRVQLRRTKGWRKPPGVVTVSRPSKWGNPYRFGDDGDRAECMEPYRADLLAGEMSFSVDDVRHELAGADLACWCRLDQPCHADVLLELANTSD